jgi:hypothetical protein
MCSAIFALNHLTTYVPLILSLHDMEQSVAVARTETSAKGNDSQSESRDNDAGLRRAIAAWNFDLPCHRQEKIAVKTIDKELCPSIGLVFGMTRHGGKEW